MVLFCEDVSRQEIANYYNVPYETVKESLLSLANYYEYYIAEECITLFKKKYNQTDEYREIITKYKLDCNNNL